MSLFAPDLRAAVEAYGGVFPPEFKKTTLADADPALHPTGFRPVGTIHQYIDEFVDDLDAVRPGGRISIVEGEADPQVWNNPLLIEAVARAGDFAGSMFEHYNRSVRMSLEERWEDSLYDLDYTIMLMEKLDLTPESVKQLEDPNLRKYMQRFGASVFSNTGNVLTSLNQPRKALQIALPKALKYNNKQPYLYANYARAHIALNNPDRAISYMQRELKVNSAYPNLPENWLQAPSGKDTG